MSNFPLYRSGHTVGLFLNKETIYNKHGHEKDFLHVRHRHRQDRR